MFYDELGRYKVYLAEFLRPETTRTYTNRLENLFEGQSLITTLDNLDMEKIINKLSDIKHKNEFSQSKNALLYFLKFKGISLDDITLSTINELERKTHRKNRKLKKIDFKDMNNKINHIQNRKLKISYQTILTSGLRVGELAQIAKEDTVITEKEICFSFTGKGGNQENVTISKTEYSKIYDNLSKLIKETKQNHKIFYSARYLQDKAQELGFACHDLRRAFSKIEYKKTRSKDETRKKLRHTSIKTTDIYLKSKIEMSKELKSEFT